MTLYVDVGLYEDGTPGEVFLDVKSVGELGRALLSCLARSISIGLQHGVPLDRYVELFSFTRFKPAGVVQGHDRIKACTSILDLLARHLGIVYGGREDLAHTKPPGEA